jgi:pimeloyl-ACP methyl ester carboxylesterase
LPGRPAWTLHGEPLPDIPNTLYPDFVATYLWDRATRTPAPQTPLILEDSAHFGDTGKVEIPVERIHGPVMLLSGEDDQIWPSARWSIGLWAVFIGSVTPTPTSR